MPLEIKIDAAGIAEQFKEFAREVEEDVKKSVANLAAITHAKVVELASTELKSSREDYLSNLGFEEVVEGVWVVGLNEDALWIEEGLEPNFDMKPGLLKNGKTGKNGKYQIIPFEHSKAPSQMTPRAQSIVSELRSNLKKQGIAFKKIEKNADGSPRIGKLHSVNFDSAKPGKGNTPSLKGVSIYQSMSKNGNIRRDIMTFRTVTSGPGSEGKWLHPGKEGEQFLDKAFTWAEKIWTDTILPEIMNKWK